MTQNPYTTLGIDKNAPTDEIKRAYRKLAAKYHPDVNKDSSSEGKFKEIQEAWEILSDPQKKAQYDQFGSVGDGAGGAGFGGGFHAEGFGGGGLGDIFESFFGGQQQRTGPQRGRDIQQSIQISFEESVTGKAHTTSIQTYVPCATCGSSGKKEGTSVKTCTTCNGVGQVERHQQTPLGIIRTAAPCQSCHGEGRIPESPCPSCSGSGRKQEEKSITIDIPAGVFDGALLRIPGKGESGERGEAPGDFLLRIHVTPSNTFERDGNDIHIGQEISLLEAVLGNDREIITISGTTTVKIPPGTQSGAVLRLRGKGMPVVNRNTKGDCFIHISIKIPKKLTKKQKELFHELVKESGEDLHYQNKKGFLEGLFS